MGLATWLASGLAAWLFAKFIPFGRPRGWIVELIVALVTAAAFGLTATALDFGGLREPDWRAALFAFLGAFSAIGVCRLVTLLRRRRLQ